jgi:hypothetical protein
MRFVRILSLLTFVSSASTVSALDCNLNGVGDDVDIAEATSDDCNTDSIPDECERLPLRFGMTGEALPLTAEPEASTAADLDGDGLPDLIVATSSTLTVYIARDDGTFEPEILYPTIRRTSAVVGADLDADGDTDLITVNWDVLLWFENRGDGSLETPREFAVRDGTRFLLVVEVNGDGRPDLVTSNPSDDIVEWLANRGNGNFGAPTSFPVPDQPVGVAAVDFDGDGDMDLAVAGKRSRTLSIHENQDGRNFTDSLVLQTPFRMTSVAAGDVDEDGFVDLVGGTGEATSVWFGNGSGGFSTPLSYPRPADNVRLVDVDGDGDLDLIVGSLDRALITLFLNKDGTGSFHPPESLTVDFESLACGDFDGDSDIDLAASTTNQLTVLRQGESGVQEFARVRHNTTGRPHGVGAGDFTGDGFPDVVTSHSVDGHSKLFYGTAEGALEPADLRDRTDPWAHTVVVADLDENGVSDLVYHAGRLLVVLISAGDGSFQEQSLYENPGSALYTIGADVDGDGHVDILSPRNGAAVLTYGDGLGALRDVQILPGGSGGLEVAVGDVDADGQNDIVTANGRSSDLTVHFQSSARLFAPAVSVPVNGAPHAVALADFDRDGDLDLASANELTQDVAVFLNSGGRSFTEVNRTPIGRSPYALVATDLDNDGLSDLVTTNEIASDLSLLRNTGGGTFALLGHSRVGSGPRLTITTDLNLDGRDDLVVAERSGRGISVFLNKSGGFTIAVASLPLVCTARDFERISSPSGAPHAERAARFLLPTAPAKASPPPLFVNSQRFGSGAEFLRQTASERYGKLTAAGYQDLVARRSTRNFFGGQVFRLRRDDDRVTFGFDVETETTTEELLSEAEIRAISAQLQAIFSLGPLLYFPRTQQARELAATFGGGDLEVWLVDDPAPSPPPTIGTPTFELEIAPETTLCGIFAEAGIERGPLVEFERKSVVQLRAGVLELPTITDTFEAVLFEAVHVGPTGEKVEPLGAGEFRVTRIPGEITTFRFTYQQEFALADGRRLELAVVSPITYEARGDEPVQKRRELGREFFVTLNGKEAFEARLDGEVWTRYGSCTYDDLPRWETRWELTDGTRVRLVEHFEEAETLVATGPAALVRAEVEFTGAPRVVTNYEELIYSASRHNTLVDYWVVLDPPALVNGVGEVHGVELRAPDADPVREAGAAYLGSSFEELSQPGIVSFTRRELVAPRFVRGDANSDSKVNLVDVTTILDHIFRRQSLPCRKAADTNDDARVNLVDAIALITTLFGQEELPLPPFPACGEDPTADGLTCDAEEACPLGEG